MGLFGDVSQTAVERALSELRAGRPVVIESAGRFLMAAAAEHASADLIAALDRIGGGQAMLVLTPARLRALGHADASAPCAIALRPLDSDRVSALVSRRGEVLHEEVRPGDVAMATAIDLAKLALLLPAMLVAPLSAESLEMIPSVTVRAPAVEAFAQNRAETLTLVSRAPVPLLAARAAEFVVFRGGEGMRDQIAVVVGNPDPDKPVMVRLHSACLTGDLFGSLRCDCGDQLRGTVATMAKAGGGVLLYLDQEGRGNGIANKIRAYKLQHEGLDTYEADETLGFDLDGRRFEFAAEMLRLLGFSQVVLMTNNPEKAETMRRSGLTVVDLQNVYGRRGADNVRYLAAKRERAGHFIDVEALEEHGSAACG
ncbi:GTP cyclohydrolase II RibA [Ancylobacter sp. VKM B-3255]|uniref:GTP cyclohydrolase-2 n=2 Tax=Ancylobacter radicis TaxID=2836179 RepID=A0ABS5RBC5_9HYPH|nr:GTP cyclohydrolase II RibA [Ancylobacter radicis]